jgi:hypothetical protein
MAKSKRRAGQNIRDLAARRRIKAINHFFGAGAVLAIPFIFSNFANSLLKSLASVNPAQPRFSLPPIYNVQGGGWRPSNFSSARIANIFGRFKIRSDY